MSEFKVRVIRVGPIQKHENADTLGITRVADYPVVVRLGDFQAGDLAVYVPVDAVVPTDRDPFRFLARAGRAAERVKAKKLRGVFSMGLLVRVPGAQEGQDLAQALGVKQYEPPEDITTAGDQEACPFDFPKYTDIEGLRAWPDLLREGEEVVLTEKVHGTSARYVYRAGRLWVGSHTTVKQFSPDSAYWKPALQLGLEERLRPHPDMVVFGEVYGWVQDLRYGHSKGRVSLVAFDVLDLNTRRYYDAPEARRFVTEALGLPFVPVLEVTSWRKSLVEFAEGPSLLHGGHVREGIVIHPVKERFDDRIGRVILKYHGQSYLLR